MNILLDSLKLLAISSFGIAISCGLVYYIGMLMNFISDKYSKLDNIINSALALVAVILISITVISGMTFIVAVLPFAIIATILVTIIIVITYLITTICRLVDKWL